MRSELHKAVAHHARGGRWPRRPGRVVVHLLVVKQIGARPVLASATAPRTTVWRSPAVRCYRRARRRSLRAVSGPPEPATAPERARPCRVIERPSVSSGGSSSIGSQATPTILRRARRLRQSGSTTKVEWRRSAGPRAADSVGVFLRSATTPPHPPVSSRRLAQQLNERLARRDEIRRNPPGRPHLPPRTGTRAPTSGGRRRAPPPRGRPRSHCRPAAVFETSGNQRDPRSSDRELTDQLRRPARGAGFSENVGVLPRVSAALLVPARHIAPCPRLQRWAERCSAACSGHGSCQRWRRPS